MDEPSLNSAARKCDKMGLSEAKRMIVMCVDRKRSKCASSAQMRESWKYLKKRLKELGLAERGGVMRLQLGCVGICKGGPIVAILPDGTWYGGCTPKTIERIIQEHLIGGNVLAEYRLAQSFSPLQNTGSNDTPPEG